MSGARPAAPGPFPLTLAERVDRASDAFEAAWRAGRAPRIEELLAGVPVTEQAAFLRELLVTEIELRRARNEEPRKDEYVGRFPGQAGPPA